MTSGIQFGNYCEVGATSWNFVHAWEICRSVSRPTWQAIVMESYSVLYNNYMSQSKNNTNSTLIPVLLFRILCSGHFGDLCYCLYSLVCLARLPCLNSSSYEFNQRFLENITINLQLYPLYYYYVIYEKFLHQVAVKIRRSHRCG